MSDGGALRREHRRGALSWNAFTLPGRIRLPFYAMTCPRTASVQLL